MEVTLSTDKDVYSINDKITGKVEYEKPSLGRHVKGIKIIANGQETTDITETREVAVSVPSEVIDENQDGVADSPTTPPSTKTEIQTIRHSDSDIFFNKEVNLEAKSPISFELQLPTDLKESYSGKHVSIAYHLEATVDIIGINPTTRKDFKVIVPSKNGTSNTKLYLNGKNGVVEAIAEINSNLFSPGDTISGKITLSNLQSTNIQTAEITLRGIEFATADNVSQNTTMEEHKTNINWNSITTGSFDLQIPASSKKSYNGKYSKYYWEIEANLVTGFSSSDIDVKNILEIN